MDQYPCQLEGIGQNLVLQERVHGLSVLGHQNVFDKEALLGWLLRDLIL